MTNHNENESEAVQDGEAPKPKPYKAPTLRVYGDVPSLTRKIANTSTNPDGGHGAMSKTR